MKRCAWAKNQLLNDYHDHIWGKPQHDEKMLFKMLILEGLPGWFKLGNYSQKRRSI